MEFLWLLLVPLLAAGLVGYRSQRARRRPPVVATLPRRKPCQCPTCRHLRKATQGKQTHVA